MLAIHLALHGALVLFVSLAGGLFLHRALTAKLDKASDWHLLHAGVSARGILLIALASIIDLPALPESQLSAIAWLMIFFVWTSTLAMLIRAVTGERGFGWEGSAANKVTYTLYLIGVIAVFPACALLIFGLFRAAMQAV